ncbi:hypothetical protein H6B15_03860 [Gemmiger formicilis]|uniref:hypothetical protein n=1 Tax=Gemmiger formicilis TaxID=745368 RepID=UPI00195E0924|nr:hypothetical protein [Gemmiger formicilis]MBM6715796.1 hypothetical protein [Gemmiger formicilis]
MSTFRYSKEELERNKVLKYNLDLSRQLQNDPALARTRSETDANIAASEALLASLGRSSETAAAAQAAKAARERPLEHQPQARSWESLVSEAENAVPGEIVLEDILSPEEIEASFRELDEINARFAQKTGIVNCTDLAFLAIATALQITKTLLFPYVAKHFGYGERFDPSQRLPHNDKSIEDAHRAANDDFRDKNLNRHPTGYWINLLYQTPPYDTTVGSPALGINMGGAYHRLYTLGHDPVLGWIFGTANILTDTITLNTFQTFRVARVPKLRILPEPVSLWTLGTESFDMIREDPLNLPAALFAQAQHLKSDRYTKVGLPVPLLAAFKEDSAASLYKSQYDSLCFSRDAKIAGASFAVSLVIDMIIGLVHGLFRQEEEDPALYQVRTRKILLISSLLASTSSVIRAGITQNPRNLDLGTLLCSVAHLCTDLRFMARIKREFVEKELDSRLQAELDEIDRLYHNF